MQEGQQFTALSEQAWQGIAASGNRPADAVRFFSQRMVPRSFGDVLRAAMERQGMDERTLVGRLTDLRPGVKRDSLRRRLSAWLNGGGQPADREEAVQICFALGLSGEAADEFLRCGGEGGFDERGYFSRQRADRVEVGLHQFGKRVARLVAHDAYYAHISEALLFAARRGGADAVRAHGDFAEVALVAQAGVDGEQQGVGMYFAHEIHPLAHILARNRTVESAVHEGGERGIRAEQRAHFGAEGVARNGGRAETNDDDGEFFHSTIIDAQCARYTAKAARSGIQWRHLGCQRKKQGVK